MIEFPLLPTTYNFTNNSMLTQTIAVANEGTIRTLDDFLEIVTQKFVTARKYVNWEGIVRNFESISVSFNSLRDFDTGGFDHAEVGQRYGEAQLNRARAISREIGYQGIFRLLQSRKKWSADDVLLDALAGNGTVSRVLESISSAPHPQYIGNDVSLTMVKQGIEDGRLIFYGDICSEFLSRNIADYCVSAYGTHHVPEKLRPDFFKGCFEKLKEGGTVVIQDFDAGSNTAAWYDKCIHEYRNGGHPYKHFDANELLNLLSGAGFKDVEIKFLYDPFIIRAEGKFPDEMLKREFFEYLVNLFALVKIDHLVGHDEGGKKLDEILSPYFKIEPGILEKCEPIESSSFDARHIASEISIRSFDGYKYLIAPRYAIAGVGRK